MDIAYDRVNLRAALDNIVAGEYESNVPLAVASMNSLLREKDEVLALRRARGQSHWTERALSMIGISTVGNYQGAVLDRDDERHVQFQQGDVRVTFEFERRYQEPKKAPSPIEQRAQAAPRRPIYQRMPEACVDFFIRSLLQTFGGGARAATELALDRYDLVRVSIARKHGRGALQGFAEEGAYRPKSRCP